MKKTILFVGSEKSLNTEIKEYVCDHNGDVFFANSLEQSIKILDSRSIDVVVLMLHKLEDAAILNYINKFHPDTQVLLSASKEYDELISIFNRGRFSLVRYPLKLEEINSFI